MAHATNFKHDMDTRVDDALDKKAEAEKTWRDCCKAVDARDHRRCRATGKKTDPDAVGLLRGHRAHIVYRSAGGPDTPENVITLSPEAHNAEHKNKLRIEFLDQALGANGPCEFWKKDEAGNWFLWRREVAVGRFERD